jgi:hypothetical protein
MNRETFYDTIRLQNLLFKMRVIVDRLPDNIKEQLEFSLDDVEVDLYVLSKEYLDHVDRSY